MLPAITLEAGVPDTVGARFGGGFTVIANGASAAFRVPSETVITMFDVVPTCCAVGVPDNRPVVLLKLAHAGLLLMEYVSDCPSGSDATGRNE